MRFQSFPIDGKRLRELRKARGLSQVNLALRICEKLGLHQDEETATSVYRRIEKRGSTSKNRAQAIADILDVRLEDLQGLLPPEPETYERRIYAHLKSQVDGDVNSVLHSELERVESESPEDALEIVAKYVSARIEAAQLCRNPDELTELAELTGLDVNELLRPANCSGHWFLSAFGAGTDSAQIIPGTLGLWMHLDALVKEQLDCHGTDARISLRRDSPWYRIEIQLPKRSMLPRSLKVVRIDLARCQPDAKGITWIQPSWTEDWLTADALKGWAAHYGNFIQTFDAPMTPSSINELRLRITEYQGSRDKQVGRIVIHPDADSTSPSVKKEAVEFGIAHALAIRQLLPGLRAFLESAIESSPRGRWSLMESQGSLAIDFYPRPLSPESSYGLRYEIDLVEDIGANEFRHAPWRTRDRKAFREIVEKWLN